MIDTLKYTDDAESRSGRVFKIERGKTIIDNLSSGERPIVSIIVPIYNAESTLSQALSTAESQTVENIEIVCVNDGSDDDSTKIIAKHAANDGRYTIVTHPENAGYGAAMNDGIQSASGEWIGILEPDDYIDNKMFEDLLRAAEKADKTLQSKTKRESKPELDKIQATTQLVKSPYIREARTVDGTPRGEGPYELLLCSYYGRIKPHTASFNIADKGATHLLRHHPSIWSAIYKREFLEKKHIEFIEYPGAGWADNEFFYETLLQAERIAYCKTPHYFYREETKAEFEAFARKNKTLPLDRWNSMMDIIERLSINDDNIIRNHIAKGFTYLTGQLEANGWDDEEILDAVYKMFERMDPMLVTDEPRINPKTRKLYIEMMNENGMLDDKLRYKIELVKEFAYTAKTNGISYALRRTRNFMKNKKK